MLPSVNSASEILQQPHAEPGIRHLEPWKLVMALGVSDIGSAWLVIPTMHVAAGQRAHNSIPDAIEIAKRAREARAPRQTSHGANKTRHASQEKVVSFVLDTLSCL